MKVCLLRDRIGALDFTASRSCTIVIEIPMEKIFRA